MKKTTTATIQAPAELMEAAQIEARRRGKTLAGLIRDYLANFTPENIEAAQMIANGRRRADAIVVRDDPRSALCKRFEALKARTGLQEKFLAGRIFDAGLQAVENTVSLIEAESRQEEITRSWRSKQAKERRAFDAVVVDGEMQELPTP